VRLVFDAAGWDDYRWWQVNDHRLLKRINQEHRLVYRIREDDLVILQARFHYDD
jgi:Txe/YoeB family toxin of Txe-Axe toxin-antitoxin module